MAGRTHRVRVTGWDGDRLVEVAVSEPSANAYGYGRLRWLTGRNSGLAAQVRTSDGREITLREPPAFAPAAGDLLLIGEGCDRRFETCTGRFGNDVNFRGEPHLPGIDLLTRYPGA